MSTTPQTPSRRQTFEEKIKALEKLSSSQPEVTIQEMLALFGTSSHYVFLCFLALPFLQPIPIPGLSQLVGSIVIISGICIFLGRSLWLPRRLKNKAIQSTTIAKIIATWKRWSQKLSKWIRVRGKFMAKDFFL
ncbi:MAG TPA: exopolysaccharide biosynthesis protein, partial [Chlamydiales bacterium]|nr:exopolysaccharide biosynthesis protein [Chlamydiales bacterium]